MTKKIYFCPAGGAEQIGMSCYNIIIEEKGKKFNVMLDCGWQVNDPKSKIVSLLDMGNFIRDRLIPPQVILISHAHADHCAGLLRFIEEFPKVEVYASPPTVDLMSSNTLEEFIRSYRRGKKKEYLDYKEERDKEIEKLKNKKIEYIAKIKLINDEYFHPLSNVGSFRFIPSGHVLGAVACQIRLNIDEKKDIKIVYTGDISIYR